MMIETEQTPNAETPSSDVREIVRQTLEEFVRGEHQKTEPAYKAELLEERKRRENLETRLNQLVDENRRAREAAEEADRNSQIRNELQKLGVAKVDLAFRAVREDIVRSDDGRLMAKGAENKSLQDYLSNFVQENPELLPARIAGGSGAQPTGKSGSNAQSTVTFDQIRPDMGKEQMDQIRQEIARMANLALKGL
jgi:hypothetical protein